MKNFSPYRGQVVYCKTISNMYLHCKLISDYGDYLEFERYNGSCQVVPKSQVITISREPIQLPPGFSLLE